jgi:hypothetical protein
MLGYEHQLFITKLIKKLLASHLVILVTKKTWKTLLYENGSKEVTKVGCFYLKMGFQQPCGNPHPQIYQ